MTHPQLPEARAAQALLATIGSTPAAPEALARSLVFAWLVSLPTTADPAIEAARLAQFLADEAGPDNPLLPHLQPLLAAIGTPNRILLS